MTIKQQVIDLAAQRFKINPNDLSADDDFYERLNINSLQAIELLTDLETAFDIEIPDYEMQGITTFSALADKIKQRL